MVYLYHLSHQLHEYWEWVVYPFVGDPPDLGIELGSCIAGSTIELPGSDIYKLIHLLHNLKLTQYCIDNKEFIQGLITWYRKPS